MPKEPAKWDDLDEGRQQRLEAALKIAQKAGNKDLVNGLQAALDGREPEDHHLELPDPQAALKQTLLDDLLNPSDNEKPL
ncbi:MAG: hypothetical protein GY914_07280 [Prochlorococcus sp.]|jgi:hypothetical protein|nr:hypothetical protein [Prochlorococcus sp.]CAI8155245.1 MAG: Uncharacterised protein [Prochlorococcus marinus str. MIT 9215]